MTGGGSTGRPAFWLATAAVAGAGCFTAWALTASVYSSGQTILEANPELLVRLAIAVPLVVAAAVWLLLHAACRLAARSARIAASAAAWLLVAFSVLTGFSIGMFVLPIALVLVVAARLTPVAAS